ncbi:MAG: ArdC-like ssDNA-binding domain-containing protein [Christensenellales bacterium]
MKFDIYSEITDRITAMLEQGVIPWEKPWSGISSGAISHATGKPYS